MDLCHCGFIVLKLVSKCFLFYQVCTSTNAGCGEKSTHSAGKIGCQGNQMSTVVTRNVGNSGAKAGMTYLATGNFGLFAKSINLLFSLVSNSHLSRIFFFCKHPTSKSFGNFENHFTTNSLTLVTG